MRLAQLSIIMPVYNEAEVIADVVGALVRDVADSFESAELLLVNDGSTDDTAAELDRLAAGDERIRVHHAERNRGHGPSLRRALDDSRGEWIFQLDSDGEQVAGEFWLLWERRDDADLVMGVRTERRTAPHRQLVSRAARFTGRLLGARNLRDVNVPFKLIHRSVWADLEPDVPTVPVAPSLLIAIGASLRGWRVAQVPITHVPRRHGPSTLNLPYLFRLSAGALRELVGFRLRLGRRAPLAIGRESRPPSVTTTP